MTKEQHGKHVGNGYASRNNSHCLQTFRQLQEIHPEDKENLKKYHFKIDCEKLINSGYISQEQIDNLLQSYFDNDKTTVIMKAELIVSKVIQSSENIPSSFIGLVNNTTIKYLKELSNQEFSIFQSQINQHSFINILNDDEPINKKNKTELTNSHDHSQENLDFFK